MEKVKYEFLENIDLSEIETDARIGRWSAILREWVKSDTKACKLSCASQAEKNRCRGAISSFVRNHKMDWTVVSERGTYNIYVVRA